jgi:hypothetical protein
MNENQLWKLSEDILALNDSSSNALQNVNSSSKEVEITTTADTTACCCSILKPIFYNHLREMNKYTDIYMTDKNINPINIADENHKLNESIKMVHRSLSVLDKNTENHESSQLAIAVLKRDIYDIVSVAKSYLPLLSKAKTIHTRNDFFTCNIHQK